MSPVVVSALLGAVAALPLLLGAWLALARPPKERTVGLIAAFGAGALVSAVSYDLVLDAVEQASPALLAAALAIGAIVYYAGDRMLAKRSSPEEGGEARGLAILLGAVLDGVPESFILGMSLVTGGGVGAAFFVAVLVSNFPEGMASAAELREDPSMGERRVLLMWLLVVGVSAVAAGIGALASGFVVFGAAAEAFAAGALLTMLIDDLIPEARERGGIGAGLFAVLGFAVAFALHELGA